MLVVYALDRLGCTVRDTLNLIHDLIQRSVGVRNLADPIRVDSSNPDNPMGQLAVVMLALFAQMERTYAIKHATHAQAGTAAAGRRTGRPSVVTAKDLEHARLLRTSGNTITEITTETGSKRSTLYRRLFPRHDARMGHGGLIPSTTPQEPMSDIR